MILFNTEQEAQLIDDIVQGRNLKKTHLYLFNLYSITTDQLKTCQSQVDQIQVTLDTSQRLLKEEQTKRAAAESSEAAAKKTANKEKERKKTWRGIAIGEGALILTALALLLL